MPDLAVIFGGPSPEHDVSVLTGLQAAHELAGAGTKVLALYWTKTGSWFSVPPELEGRDFAEGVPAGATPLRLVLGSEPGFKVAGGRLGRERAVEIDVAVVCCHGGPGEDGALQGVLDLAGIAYTGPSAAGAALGMDKLAFSALVGNEGLPVLPRQVLRPGLDPGFPGPYIVKPRFGGSSIGIEVVADLETALAMAPHRAHWRAGAVVEPYRADLYDVQVAVRRWPALELSAFERPLRTPRAGGVAGEPEILGYADKYVGGEGMASAPRELPASLPAATEAKLREAASRVAEAAMVRGVARIDFLSDGTDFVVNEVNTIPGSLARYLWIDPPRRFGSLLADMMGEARAVPTRSLSTSGADGTVLRGAGAIAAKLA